MSSFWDRRKAAVQAEARAEEAAQAVAVQQAEDARLAEIPDEVLLAEHDLPAPEDLVDADDVRRFLKAELPQRLKTRALRRLWRTNPVLANLDGLVDYADDFTNGGKPFDKVNTVYVVGKGMLAGLEALAEAARLEAEKAGLTLAPQASNSDILAQPTSDTEALSNSDIVARALAQDSAPVPAVRPPEAPQPEPAPSYGWEDAGDTDGDGAADQAPSASRRMRFHFEPQT